MKRQSIRFFLNLSIMIMLIQPGNVLAKKVKGYKELYAIMAQETSIRKNKIKQIIDDAERKMGVDYTKNRVRQLKVKKPIEFFKLNSAFMAVSFEATDLTKTIREDAVFTLLFQKKRANQISYTTDYLKFVGKSSIEDYSKINQEKLCENFQKVNSNLNCKEEEETQLQFKKSPTISLAVKKEFDALGKRVDKKADLGHKHDGADITAGVVAEKYIDPMVARDAELASEVAKMQTEVSTVQNKMKSQIEGLKKEMLGKVVSLQKEMKSEVKQVQSGMSRGLSDIKQKALQQKNAGNVNPEYVKKLEKKVAELEKTVKALAAILKDVQRNGDALIFSGMNVFIQNGTGKTESTNGKGNLIVGYNETRPALNERDGSHNIVVGSQNNFKSYGGIVSGVTNAITGKYASVTGGKQNTASGSFASVSGGHLNKASGNYSSVSGGLTRSAAGSNSWQGGEYSSKQ